MRVMFDATEENAHHAPKQAWAEAGGSEGAAAGREGLRGRVTRHHRFLLHLQQIDALEPAIAEIDQEVDTHLSPFRAAVGC